MTTTNHVASSAPAALLATKTFLPRARPDLLPRPRLLAALDSVLMMPLTLIAAPAGFGKTTLLASWLEWRNSAAYGVGRLHAAWLALDADDNDPATFLRYLIAALRTLASGAGAETLALIRSPLPPRPILLAPLINDLAGLPADHVLVLDDYHLITTPEIHQMVGFLLERLPPGIHLVIATREDPPLPLARMRARRQLLEIRAADLRFTPEEAELFLGEVMRLRLPREDMAALASHAEGWVTGLQLAALALKDRTDTAPLIAGLTAGHRYIIDYLASEVLDRLPAHLRLFLLQTAILDRMCGPLCDAVLGLEEAVAGPSAPAGTQSYSRFILEELERQHLFVVPLDDERRWYRYHHLFATFLRARLFEGAAESQVAILHRRAGAWFERHGLIEEAIQHAFAGSDLERAASLIARAGLRIAGDGHVHTVLGWLSSIPDPQIRSRPELCLMYAVILLSTNQSIPATAWLEEAERHVHSAAPEDSHRTLRGQVRVARARLAGISGDIPRCVAEAEQALELLEGAPPGFRAVATLNTAFAFLVSGDVTAAGERRVKQAVAATRDAGHPAAHLASLVTFGRLQTLQGRRRQAGETYAQALQMLPTSEHARTLSGAASAYLHHGEWLHEQNMLDQAERQLAQGMELVRESLTVDADVILVGAVAQMKLCLAHADSAGALGALHSCEQTLAERAVAPHLVAKLAAARALVYLQAGNSMAARWAETVDPEIAADSLFLRELEYVTLARVWLAQAQAGGAAHLATRALHLLSHLLSDAESKARMDSAIRIRTLQALALHSAGETGQALAALSPALAIAAPQGYTRIFVDEGAPLASLLHAARSQGVEPSYVTRLLDALRNTSAREAVWSSPSDGPMALAEPLTAREIEVLRLIAGGASNQGVANALIISVGTVKKHVNNILGKLDVRSRTQAVARGRELGLI